MSKLNNFISREMHMAENINKQIDFFTIGHSNYTMDFLIQQLISNNINCVVDVRSVPYSKYVPHFNIDCLEEKFAEYNISYIYMGDLIGARYSDPNLLYQDGKVNFNKVRVTKRFIEGIEKLKQLHERNSIITLLCSEKDPFDCHRFVLISHELMKNGINVNHILEDGTQITNNELEERLLTKYMKNYNQTTLTWERKTKEEAIEEAYEERNKDIAYTNDVVLNLYTIGFTKKTAQKFFDLLVENKIKKVIDIRLNNKSQLAGFTKCDDLGYFLKTIGNIEYVHMPDYAPTKELLDAYKGKLIDWNEYEKQYIDILNQNISKTIDYSFFSDSCLLCSEPTPTYCHRRLLSEYLSNENKQMKIIHIL